MNFVRVGKVKDAHGIRGELFVVLFAGEAEWLPKLSELRLVQEATGTVQTFAVKSARLHKNGLIVKSNDIKDRNQAETLKQLLVEIPEDFLVSKTGESIYLREIQGFLLRNRGENVGRIEKFSSNTAQDLLVVTTPTGEYEIPFVEAFVTKIDYPAKIVDMDLPSGLLGEAADEDTSGESQDGQQDHLADE